MKFAYQVTTLFIGLGGYRTRVDNTDIRLIIDANTHKSDLLKLAGDGRTLRKVEFATKCMEINLAHNFCKNTKIF
jgi:hypothetical protein